MPYTLIEFAPLAVLLGTAMSAGVVSLMIKTVSPKGKPLPMLPPMLPQVQVQVQVQVPVQVPVPQRTADILYFPVPKRRPAAAIYAQRTDLAG